MFGHDLHRILNWYLNQRKETKSLHIQKWQEGTHLTYLLTVETGVRLNTFKLNAPIVKQKLV